MEIKKITDTQLEPSALKSLNYRHLMLLEKLSEVDIRIFNIAKAIGGEFEYEESLRKEYDINDNIVDVYSYLLQETNNTLESISKILNRLERLSVN